MDGKQYSAGKYYLPLILIVLFYSCANNSNNDAAFKMFNENLVSSNDIIDRSTGMVYKSLEDKLSDPTTAPKAQIWYPKAKKVKELSKDVTDYIESLKTDALKEKTLSKKHSNELYSQLGHYKNDLQEIDTSMKLEFEDKIVIISSSFDSIKAKQDAFYKAFFEKVSTAGTTLMLNKFQNNIRIIENQLVRFCNNHCSQSSWDDFGPMVYTIINSEKVSIGNQITITAGLGTFRIYPETEIVIDGKNVALDQMGVAEYTFKAQKVGKHVATVRVSFIDQDGKKEIISKPIEYRVME